MMSAVEDGDKVLCAPTEWRGPVPVEEPESAGFWQSLRDHRLKIQRCQDCGTWIHYPNASCPDCGSSKLDYEAASETGTLFSFTVSNREFGLGFELPYVSGYVVLDDPPVRLATNVVGCRPSDLSIGLPVRVVYQDYPERNLTLAYFTPRDASDADR
jgi:uncharacterized protein